MDKYNLGKYLNCFQFINIIDFWDLEVTMLNFLLSSHPDLCS